MDIYDIFNKLNIQYEEIEHNPIYSVEDAIKEDVMSKIDGVGCKNLLLKDNKNYYLIILKYDKKIDLKELRTILNSGRLSFASENELNDLLNLVQGSISPFGIINDLDNKVIIAIDQELDNKKLLFHPNVNNKTISIRYGDLVKFIDSQNHKLLIF